MARRILLRLQQIARATRGAMAVEFAMIAPVFFALLFSFLETGLLMTKMSLLDAAAAKAARQVYVGAAPDQATLEQLICDEVALIHDCANNINIEMSVIADFNDIPSTNMECRDTATPDFEPAVNYTTGGSASIVYMRICVTTALITPGLGIGMGMTKTDADRYQMVSGFAFMNEPF